MIAELPDLRILEAFPVFDITEAVGLDRRDADALGAAMAGADYTRAHALLNGTHWFAKRGGLTHESLNDLKQVLRRREAGAVERQRQLLAEADRMDRQQRAPQSTSRGDSSDASLVLLSGESIQPKPVRWLWNGWLAQGKLHILAGAPGTGKTTIALRIAATVTRGGRWPDGSASPAGSVLIASFEDDPKDTLAPRLLAMGADMSRIKFVTAAREGDKLRCLDAGDHASLLAAAISEHDARLVIADPVISALGSFDSHKNAETRMALQPFADVAADTGAALFGIAHFSKGTAGREPLERVSGSLAFGALARVVLGAAKIKTEGEGERRILLRLKSNIGQDDGGFEYVLRQDELTSYPGIFGSCVQWGEAVEGAARDLLAEADSEDNGCTSAGEAADTLRCILAEGRLEAKIANRTMADAGFTDKQTRRARESLGIKPKREGFGAQSKFWWMLPPLMPSPTIDAHCCPSKRVGINDINGASMEEPTNSARMVEGEV